MDILYFRKIFENPKFFEVKIECNKCGYCCIGTEMELLPEDIERILKLGYKLQEFAKFDGIYWRLKTKNGYCIFFNKKDNTCTIYEYRPIGCRLYPLQWNGFDVEIDKRCPMWFTIPKSEIDRLKPYVKYFVEYAKLTNIWIKFYLKRVE